MKDMAAGTLSSENGSRRPSRGQGSSAAWFAARRPPVLCGGSLMGSVSWRKRGNRYLVSWRMDDGSQGGKTVDTPDEARDLAAEKPLELRRGAWRERRSGQGLFRSEERPGGKE